MNAFTQASELSRRFSQRCEALSILYRNKTVAELRSIEPALPRNGSAIFLAHNWLVCGKDRDKSRKARWILRQHQERNSNLNRLNERYWHKLYARAHKAEFGRDW